MFKYKLGIFSGEKLQFVNKTLIITGIMAVFVITGFIAAKFLEYSAVKNIFVFMVSPYNQPFSEMSSNALDTFKLTILFSDNCKKYNDLKDSEKIKLDVFSRDSYFIRSEALSCI